MSNPNRIKQKLQTAGEISRKTQSRLLMYCEAVSSILNSSKQIDNKVLPDFKRRPTSNKNGRLLRSYQLIHTRLAGEVTRNYNQIVPKPLNLRQIGVNYTHLYDWRASKHPTIFLYFLIQMYAFTVYEVLSLKCIVTTT